MFFWFQRVIFFALCCLFVFSCRSPKPRQWEIQDIISQTPRFNAGRLLFTPDSSSSFELELARNRSGMRFYINFFTLEGIPYAEDPSYACIEMLFENQEPWVVYPYLLAGNQRLLLPGKAADALIQTLLEGSSCAIRIGQHRLMIIPNQFASAYEKLLSLPIN